MQFKKIRFRNFLSFGNKFTELDLSQNKTILVTGENGAGKTTALEAFYFGMTGKPFRKIKKDELINTTNKKDLLVEIEFEDNGSEYLVKRGIKPNIFELYKDSELMNMDANSKDYQKTLELLVGVDSDTFANTIFVSSKNYIPFLKLSASDRRNFVENVLNLKVFSEMCEELKTQRGILKEVVTELSLSLDNVKDKYNLAEESNRKFSQNSEDKINALLEKNKELETQILNWQEEINSKDTNSLNTQIQEIETQIDNINNEYNNELKGINESKQKYISEYSQYKNSLSQLSKDESSQILVLENNLKSETAIQDMEIKNNERMKKDLLSKKDFYNKDICPTCGQKIHLDDFKSELDKLETDIKNCDKAIEVSINKKETMKNEFIKKQNKIKNDICIQKQELNNKIVSLEEVKNSIDNDMAAIDKKYDEIKNTKRTSLNQLKNELSYVKEINNKILMNNRVIGNNNTEIKEQEKLKNTPLIDLKEFIEKGKELKKEKISKEYDLQNIMEVINILSDKGIKSYILKKYIPILNDLTNRYLEIFSAKYRIAFDETFDLEIFARGYEKLSYGSFSSGEEQRLDLSLLFAFYELGKMKKSINTNVVFFDEISDKSLDSDGINGLLNIFKSLKNSGKTVYNISHRVEMQDKFDKVLEVNKNMFSQLTEI